MKLPGVLTGLLVSLRTCGCNMGSGFSTQSGWEMVGIDMDTAATPFGFSKMKKKRFLLTKHLHVNIEGYTGAYLKAHLVWLWSQWAVEGYL